MGAAKAKLAKTTSHKDSKTVLGVFATSDPRIDQASRTRCRNIVKMVADKVAAHIPDIEVVYSETLVDGEPQADQVARELLDAGAKMLVCAPDTWAFPQLTAISLLQQFPSDTPINLTCGNSGPKPGVVFAHALNGAPSRNTDDSHISTSVHGPTPVPTPR